MKNMPSQWKVPAAAKELGEHVISGLRTVLPEIWTFDDTAHPRTRTHRPSRPPSYGHSDVTALLLQETCHGSLVCCGAIDGEYRFGNNLGWCVIDLMPDGIMIEPGGDNLHLAETYLDIDRETLLQMDPTIFERFNRFRTRTLKYALARKDMFETRRPSSPPGR
jgi:hypothetical protein